ncbi:MAG: surfeit locus 1 family protein [Methylocystaceae bacterium]|nr:MAG: surfeit locus 1 family protein [Methylocystaceae bacterium]KAF0213644.1 MAG: surfeit locus 1 family [Methylocystaceae bacterium]TXT43382.1 MAG: surfeit locus 1 family protein [Methylocystaceae bacterium]
MSAAVRALLGPAVATTLLFALLVSLGFWQVRRLGEKEALIARVEQRSTQSPQPIPPADRWASLRAEDYDFMHVRAAGRFIGGRDALVFAAPPEGASREPGYWLLTPFALTGGGLMLVDRGFLPASKAGEAAIRAAPPGEATLVGLLRAPERRNPFTPADQPEKGVFFARDPAAIAGALGLADVAPFALVIDAAPAAGPDWPRPVGGVPTIVNNHFSYAVTWFSLSLALLVIFALYARGVLARADAP